MAMALFVARCERAEGEHALTEADAALLAGVSAGNAARYGVAIQAEAVLDADRSLVLIVEAAGREQVEEFMATFARRGRVQVHDGSPAEEALGGERRAAPSAPALSECPWRRMR
jgi:hypothetical protein